MTDKVQKIREEVEKLHGNPYYMMAVKDVLEILDMQEEPVSEDLEEAAKDYSNNLDNIYGSIGEQTRNAFKAGAKWGKNQAKVEIQAQSMALAHGCPEENTSDDLEDAADQYSQSIHSDYSNDMFDRGDIYEAVIYGAEWQKEKLWKPADGDDLPEYEREVVVFTQNFPDDAGIMSVAIGHRPNPDGWDGKSLSTGKVEHYTPKTYGKGGWNIPNVKYLLDVKLPKEIEL